METKAFHGMDPEPVKDDLLMKILSRVGIVGKAVT